MPSLYRSKTECCGCSACADACPRDAITMRESGDGSGFLYPSVNPDLCVECGRCEKVCAFGQPKQTASNAVQAYACKAKDTEVRMHSSSGGVFTVLSDYVLEQGGVVYGAVYDENMQVRHARATTKPERDRMRGSKYIQSNTAGIYRQVKQDLKDGKLVLFSGVPCQVAAVKSFLGKDYDNLILVDVVCHGVPDPAVWERFVKYIEQKYGHGALTDYAFRNKKVSWRRYSPKMTFQDGKVVGETHDALGFIDLFRYDVCLRPSCTACRYTSLHREGDVTIGDFWGIENVQPELDDGKGVSALMVNTPKAAALIEKLSDKLELSPCTPEQIAARQPNLSRPSAHSTKSAEFSADLRTLPFEQVLKKHTRAGLKRRLVERVKKLLGRG